MSSDTINREEVLRLQREGWRFRIKTVKGKQYISARKGSEEKGLGPFRQDLWDTVAETTGGKHEPDARSQPKYDVDGAPQIDANLAEPSNPYIIRLAPNKPPYETFVAKFSRGEIEKALFDIRYERARVKMRDCKHAWNGFCHFWNFERGSKLIASIYERFGVEDYQLQWLSNHAQTGQEIRDLIRVSELLCFDCEEFTLRVEVS